MELMLRDGCYVPAADGGFCSVEGSAALEQRARMRLAARRGSFPPLPEYGSRLYTLCRFKPGERAAAARLFAVEALAPEPEIEVGELFYTPGPGDRATLEIRLRCAGRPAAVKLSL